MQPLPIQEDHTQQAAEICRHCAGHEAISSIRRFNARFGERPLTHEELTLFLASMTAFNRHTIGGIAALASRVSDALIGAWPYRAHSVAAYVLDAAVDEYGLRETKEHASLALDFAEHLGIGEHELQADANAVPSAVLLGRDLFDWYRTAPVPFALGVHFASEATSIEEFGTWYEIFPKFPEYRLARDSAEFEYIRTHFIHEPDHSSHAELCLAQYLELSGDSPDAIIEGADAYLSGYATMFDEVAARLG